METKRYRDVCVCVLARAHFFRIYILQLACKILPRSPGPKCILNKHKSETLEITGTFNIGKASCYSDTRRIEEEVEKAFFSVHRKIRVVFRNNENARETHVAESHFDVRDTESFEFYRPIFISGM